MSYVKTLMHQLFEAPVGLTVVFRRLAISKEEIAKRAKEDGRWVTAPRQIVLPVMSYVVLDIVHMRRRTGPKSPHESSYQETDRYRAVEPMVYCGHGATSWLISSPDQEVRGVSVLGLVPLRAVHSTWEGREGDEGQCSPKFHYFDGLYLNGKTLDAASSAVELEHRVFVKKKKAETLIDLHNRVAATK